MVAVFVGVVPSVGVWQLALLVPPGSATSFLCLDTGCCQKAYGGHSGRASLGSLSERLGMGRAGSRMASPLRNTHNAQIKFKAHGEVREDVMHRRRLLEKFLYTKDLIRQTDVNHRQDLLQGEPKKTGRNKHIHRQT